ncbi:MULTISPECIES: site-specific integrase [unclassified Rhizobium]|uniref:tyrosine-type recombinase/integrase n=1 Tax=unclassified Rhizobium TaxID=2613769 RepID=UPI0016153FFD|nr:MULTISPECIES: site-specific integrase [unclassified Rhizobium]MBB3385515.1 integrase [Rhizobium sp. BK098]MBB3617220.1 integrase [Rhizobium sp. BK609]MBB3682944.1 integrase [Rhizobium sp. BK612]
MSEWRLTRLQGEFCVTWDEPGGIRRRYRLGTRDQKEASRLAASRYAELTRPKGTTVEDLWKAYVIAKEGRAVVGTMKFTWKALKDRFGKMEGMAITILDCQAHTAERRKAGIQDGTIHTELGHLRTVLVWSEKNGLIARAPHIERPAKPDPKDGYLKRDEVGKMIEGAKVPHIRLAIMLMIGTGARNAAALELTWDRVDFERRLINLRNPFDRAPRKGRATVPMNETLMRELKLAKQAALSPYVIEWAGVQVKSIKKGLKAAAKAAKISDVSPHMLRHSAAVWLAEDGHSMTRIAQFLGHSNSRITEKVYARYSPEHLRDLADTLDLTANGGKGEYRTSDHSVTAKRDISTKNPNGFNDNVSRIAT